MTFSNIQPDANPQAIPGFMLWQVSKLWQRQLSTTLKPFGIGNTEFVLLGNAVRFTQLGQPATPAMLMDATKIDRMTASQTIRSLEKKYLVERVNLPNDKRTFHITPTPKGAKLADDALGEVIKTHTQFFAPLRDQTGQFLAYMQTLIQENSDARAI